MNGPKPIWPLKTVCGIYRFPFLLLFYFLVFTCSGLTWDSLVISIDSIQFLTFSWSCWWCQNRCSTQIMNIWKNVILKNGLRIYLYVMFTIFGYCAYWNLSVCIKFQIKINLLGVGGGQFLKICVIPKQRGLRRWNPFQLIFRMQRY